MREVTPNVRMYTGGPSIQFFARPLGDSSGLTPISDVLMVTTDDQRTCVLLAAINIFRWASSLEQESVLPLIKHSLGTALNRESPFDGLTGDSNGEVTVTIWNRYKPKDVLACI